MRPSSVRQLIKIRTPKFGVERRLSTAYSIADMHRAAVKRLPIAVRGYLEGGADEELTLRGNRQAYRERQLVPKVLVDVDNVSTESELFGHTWSAPIGLSPTGYTRMFSNAGEHSVGAAAVGSNIPYVLSTVGTTSLTQLITEDGLPPRNVWFQLYPVRDKATTWKMVDHAASLGVPVLELAVDSPFPGNRLRDKRSGFTVPPDLTIPAVLEMGLHPNYWIEMLRGADLRFANFDDIDSEIDAGSIDIIGSQFDPGVTWDDLAELRERWPGTLVLKGMFDVDDAQHAHDLGVDAFHLSNHGGRQLDKAPSPLDVLPRYREHFAPAFPIIVDSGIRSGVDVAVALAAGATSAFVGRPYLWGLIAGGQRGVTKTIDILTSELRRTMQLLGVTTIAELRERGPELLLPKSSSNS